MTQLASIICVDGPSGAGKGTLSELLASRLGWNLLDSGALYRVVGLACERSGVKLTDHIEAARIARELQVIFRTESGGVKVYLEGEDVSALIRTEESGRRASVVAKLSSVRETLLARQRRLAKAPGLVADGRDMGTTVFPEAELKIFLIASVEARAERRFKQLQGQNEGVSLRRLSEVIRRRDARDKARAASPLIPAPDAFVLDSTKLSTQEVFVRAWDLIVTRGLIKGTLG